MNDEKLMKLALAEVEISVKDGNAPFGVIVVEDGKVIWKDHDRVKELVDPTAHGEINAIRALCEQRQSLKLEKTIFYTTSEPGITCLSAMIKANVKGVVFGANTEVDASLPIAVKELVGRASRYKLDIKEGVLAEECLIQRRRYTD